MNDTKTIERKGKTMATATKPRTIGRNQTKKIEDVFSQAKACWVYTLDNFFIAESVDPEVARRALNKHIHAKLRDNGNGTYTVQVHSNFWYRIEG